MQTSPLLIDFYYIESLRWELQDDFDSATTTPLLTPDELDFDLQRNDESSRESAYRLTLELKPLEGRFPYSFKIVMVGHFRMADELPDELIVQVADANAPALLYSAAREALSASLGRGPFRPPLLPSVNFLNLRRPSAKEPGTVVVEGPAVLAPTKKRKSLPAKKSTG